MILMFFLLLVGPCAPVMAVASWGWCCRAGVIWLSNFWSPWSCVVVAGKMGIQSIAAVLLAIVFFTVGIELFCRQWATSPFCLAGRLGALRLYQLATGSFIWPFHLTSPLLTSRSAHHPFDSFTSFSPYFHLVPYLWFDFRSSSGLFTSTSYSASDTFILHLEYPHLTFLSHTFQIII